MNSLITQVSGQEPPLGLEEYFTVPCLFHYNSINEDKLTAAEQLASRRTLRSFHPRLQVPHTSYTARQVPSNGTQQERTLNCMKWMFVKVSEIKGMSAAHNIIIIISHRIGPQGILIIFALPFRMWNPSVGGTVCACLMNK